MNSRPCKPPWLLRLCSAHPHHTPLLPLACNLRFLSAGSNEQPSTKGPRIAQQQQYQYGGAGGVQRPLGFSPGAPNVAPASPPASDYLTLFRQSNQGRLSPYSPYAPGKVPKLMFVSRYLLKQDILHYFRGCDLRQEHVKFVYGANFWIDHVLLECDSHAKYRKLINCLERNGRLGFRFPKMELAPPLPWNVIDSLLKDAPRGRTLVMTNLPTAATIEDIERFFRGYSYDPTCVRIATLHRERGGRRLSSRHAVVAFTTELEALRAMREKKGDICVAESVDLRLIQ